MKGKYALFMVGLFCSLLVTTAVVYYGFVYISPFIQRYFGWSGKDPRTTYQLIRCALDIVLLNCPAIGGLAVGLKLLKEWDLKQQRTIQLATAKAKAELQLLKSQVHPHFLFNTLNNIYSFILSFSPKAPEMVRQLSGMLRYIIYECDQPQVPLQNELNMIRDYMELEKIRYGEQMGMSIDITGDAGKRTIAPLLLLPFIENSFKHGTSKMLSKSWLTLRINMEKDILYFLLNNSKPEEYSSTSRTGGIGLLNVQKRLKLLYPGDFVIKITTEPGHFTVLLELKLTAARKENNGIKIKMDSHVSELA